jgi:hypothetical protein
MQPTIAVPPIQLTKNQTVAVRLYSAMYAIYKHEEKKEKQIQEIGGQLSTNTRKEKRGEKRRETRK